jgi:hypothetical protein
VREFKLPPWRTDELIDAINYFAVFNRYDSHGAGAVAAAVGRLKINARKKC